MLSTTEFAFENQALLWLSLNQYHQNKLDFVDALIGELNKKFGRSITLTFDQAVIRDKNFKLAQQNIN